MTPKDLHDAFEQYVEQNKDLHAPLVTVHGKDYADIVLHMARTIRAQENLCHLMCGEVPQFMREAVAHEAAQASAGTVHYFGLILFKELAEPERQKQLELLQRNVIAVREAQQRVEDALAARMTKHHKE